MSTSPSAGPPLHADLAPLEALLGAFEGPGRGDYPTIEPFAYVERVTFGHGGRPFLTYQQATWNPETGAPMHAEVGYVRLAAPDRVELTLAHPTGIVEVQEGTLAGDRIELRSSAVAHTTTAKQVRALRRRFVVAEDELTTDLWMSYGEQDDVHHLRSVLQRVR